MPAIKRFPTCTPAHRPIEGLLALRQQHGFTADDVESVESNFHLHSLSRTDPQEAIAGPNSMPFILAIALLDGKVALEQFTDEKIHDPCVRAVMQKIKPRPNAHRPGEPERADRITVTLKNGSVHTILGEGGCSRNDLMQQVGSLLAEWATPASKEAKVATLA